MKKLFVFVAILFVLSGCDNTDSSLMTMTCNSTGNTRNGISTETKYDFKYDDDKIKYITMTYHYRDNNNEDVDGLNADTDGLDEDNSTNNGNNNNNNARNREATNGDMNGTTNNATNGTDDNNMNGTTTDGMNGNASGTSDGTANGGNTNGTTYNNDNTIRNGNGGMTNNNSSAGMSSDDIVDGVVGDTIDGVINTITDTIYDIAGLRTAMERQYAMFDNIEGFSYDVDTSSDTEYKIVFKFDMDVISDDNLARFNLDRNLDNVRDNYEGLGFTCR